MHEPRRPDDIGGAFMNRGEDQAGSFHGNLICSRKEWVYFIGMRDRGYWVASIANGSIHSLGQNRITARTIGR